MEIKVGQGSLDDVLVINDQIDEFEVHFDKNYFNKQIEDKDYLIVVATVDNVLVGYQISWVNQFNSWIDIFSAAVIKEYRGVGVLKKMEEYLVNWSINKKIYRIKSNVNNKRKEMLIAKIKMGYEIVGVELSEGYDKSRVFFEKRIK